MFFKVYLRFLTALFLAVVTFFVAVPRLLSAPDTNLVFLGGLLFVIVIPVEYVLVRAFVRDLRKYVALKRGS